MLPKKNKSGPDTDYTLAARLAALLPEGIRIFEPDGSIPDAVRELLAGHFCDSADRLEGMAEAMQPTGERLLRAIVPNTGPAEIAEASRLMVEIFLRELDEAGAGWSFRPLLLEARVIHCRRILRAAGFNATSSRLSVHGWLRDQGIKRQVEWVREHWDEFFGES